MVFSHRKVDLNGAALLRKLQVLSQALFDENKA